MKLINLLLSHAWSSVSALTRASCGAGILKQRRLPCRVVSVGNIQAGGAGKTPLVARLANEAIARGLTPVILSRGYRGQWENSGGVIAPADGSVSPSICGDEPALLHHLVPKAYIGVGSDRVAQFEAVRKILGRVPDLVILDDGFQHWKIHKDREILAVTSAEPGERLFRDWPSALRHADLVIWTKGREEPELFGRPMARVSFGLSSGRSSSPLWFISGIGDPVSATDELKSAGYEVRKQTLFPDHAQYERQWIDRAIEQAREENVQIAITGKDWVKWQELGVSQKGILVFEPELLFEEGAEAWERVLWG